MKKQIKNTDFDWGLYYEALDEAKRLIRDEKIYDLKKIIDKGYKGWHFFRDCDCFAEASFHTRIELVEFAAGWGKLNVVKFLVEERSFPFEPYYGSSWTEWRSCPLSRAAKWGHESITEYLIDELGAEVTEESVAQALLGGHKALAIKLCHKGGLNLVSCYEEYKETIEDEARFYGNLD